MGAQGQVWTEYIPTTKQVDYMTYPRGCALAEVAWASHSKRDFEEFYLRLKVHAQLLDCLKVNCRKLDRLSNELFHLKLSNN